MTTGLSISAYLFRVVMRISQFVVWIMGHHVGRMRANYERFTARLPIPKSVTVTTNIISDKLSGLAFQPKGQVKGKAILFFHGGGYCVGSSKTHRSMVARLSELTGYYTILPDYQLAPEYPFPAALEDARLSLQYLLAQGYKPEDISVGGDSAGGGLTMALLLDLKSALKPSCGSAFLFSPWLDLCFTGESIKYNHYREDLVIERETRKWAEYYAGNNPRNYPLISPTYADHSGLPKILIQVGGREAVLSDSLRLEESLKKANGQVELQVYKGLFHDWQMFWAYMKEADEALEETARFITKD